MEIIKKRLGSYIENVTDMFFSEEITEVIVPDTNPDYESTISAFSICKVIEKSTLSGSLRISGQIVSNIHYTSKASECAYNIYCTTPFTQNHSFTDISPQDKIISNTEVLSTTIEIVNSRKIRVISKLCTRYTIFHFSNIEIIEDICGEVGEGIKLLSNKAPINYCCDISEKLISFTEEIMLNSSEIDFFYRIIRWNSNWIIDEKKIVQNKVMLRGHISINVYSSEEHNLDIQSKSYNIPFSQIVECQNTYDEDVVECFLKQPNCSIKLIQKDGVGYLLCDCFANVSLITKRTVSLKYVSDLYSVNYPLESSSLKLCFDDLPVQRSKDLCIEEKIDCKDFVNKIIDANFTHSFSFENNKNILNVTLNAQISYYDSTGNILNENRCFKHTVELDCEVQRYGIEIIEESTNASAVASEIIITFNAKCIYTTNTYIFVEPIVSCSLNTSKKKIANNKGNLIIRKILSNETVWSIAKQYSTTTDAILSANALVNESLEEGKLILIPLFK